MRSMKLLAAVAVVAALVSGSVIAQTAEPTTSAAMEAKPMKHHGKAHKKHHKMHKKGEAAAPAEPAAQ